jgi:hypothetical protein
VAHPADEEAYPVGAGAGRAMKNGKGGKRSGRR